jgi:hypothetical protein
MICAEVRSRMSGILDQRVSVEERTAIEEHLAGCEPCRAELGELKVVDTALRGMPLTEAPAGYQETLWSRLKMTIEQDKKDKKDKKDKEEDSGLIEIRKMASRDISAQEEARKRASQEMVAVSVTEIPTSVSQPMAVVPPPAAKRTARWIVPVAGVAGLVMVAGVAFALLMRDQRTLVRADAPPGAPPPVPAAFQTGPAETGPAPSSQPTPVGGPTVAMATPEEAGGGKPAAAPPAERRPAKADRRGDHEARPAAKAHAAAAPKEPKPVAVKKDPDPGIEAPKAATKRDDDLDELLKSGTAAKKEERKVDADDNFPEALGQEQIKGGMAAVRGKVQACFDKFQVPGLAKLNVTISKAGAVTSARVTGDFASSPTGECVTAAVKTATFPRFKGKPLSISYTFLLR